MEKPKKTKKPKTLKDELLTHVSELKRRLGIISNPEFPIRSASKRQLIEYITQWNILRYYKRYHGSESEQKWLSVVKKFAKQEEKDLPISITTLQLMKQSQISEFLLKFFQSLEIAKNFKSMKSSGLKKYIKAKRVMEMLGRPPLDKPPKSDVPDKIDKKPIEKAKIPEKGKPAPRFTRISSSAPRMAIQKSQDNLYREKVNLEIERLRSQIAVSKAEDQRRLKDLIETTRSDAQKRDLSIQKEIKQLERHILSTDQDIEESKAIFSDKLDEVTAQQGLRTRKAQFESEKFEAEAPGMQRDVELSVSKKLADIEKQISAVQSDADKRESIRQSQMETEMIKAETQLVQEQSKQFSAELQNIVQDLTKNIQQETAVIKSDIEKSQQQMAFDRTQTQSEIDRLSGEGKVHSEKINLQLGTLRDANKLIVERAVSAIQNNQKINDSRTQEMTAVLQRMLAENEVKLSGQLQGIKNETTKSKAETDRERQLLEQISVENKRFAEQVTLHLNRQTEITKAETASVTAAIEKQQVENRKVIENLQADRQKFIESTQNISDTFSVNQQIETKIQTNLTQLFDARLQAMSKQIEHQYGAQLASLQSQNKIMSENLKAAVSSQQIEEARESLKYVSQQARIVAETKVEMFKQLQVGTENQVRAAHESIERHNHEMQKKYYDMSKTLEQDKLEFRASLIKDSERSAEAKSRIADFGRQYKNIESEQDLAEFKSHVSKMGQEDWMETDIPLKQARNLRELQQRIQSDDASPLERVAYFEAMRDAQAAQRDYEQLLLETDKIRFEKSQIGREQPPDMPSVPTAPSELDVEMASPEPEPKLTVTRQEPVSIPTVNVSPTDAPTAREITPATPEQTELVTEKAYEPSIAKKEKLSTQLAIVSAEPESKDTEPEPLEEKSPEPAKKKISLDTLLKSKIPETMTNDEIKLLQDQFGPYKGAMSGYQQSVYKELKRKMKVQSKFNQTRARSQYSDWKQKMLSSRLFHKPILNGYPFTSEEIRFIIKQFPHSITILNTTQLKTDIGKQNLALYQELKRGVSAKRRLSETFSSDPKRMKEEPNIFATGSPFGKEGPTGQFGAHKVFGEGLGGLNKKLNLAHTEPAQIHKNITKSSDKQLQRALKMYKRALRKDPEHDTGNKILKGLQNQLKTRKTVLSRAKGRFESKILQI